MKVKVQPRGRPRKLPWPEQIDADPEDIMRVLVRTTVKQPAGRSTDGGPRTRNPTLDRGRNF